MIKLVLNQNKSVREMSSKVSETVFKSFRELSQKRVSEKCLVWGLSFSRPYKCFLLSMTEGLNTVELQLSSLHLTGRVYAVFFL